MDEISGGRLILGLGAGWNEVEYRAFGFPFDHRTSRFEEAFTIIRTLLRDGEIDFNGRYYQVRDCRIEPRGPRPGGPPLMIGSNGPRMLRIAAPHVDAWNSWYDKFGNRAEGVPRLIAAVDAACRDVGRDRNEIERTVAVLVRLTGGVGRNQGDRERNVAPPLSGSTEELAAAMRSFADAGISHVQLVLDPITRASIEEFGAVLRLLDRG